MGYIMEQPIHFVKKFLILVDGFIFTYHSKALQAIRAGVRNDFFNARLGGLATDRVLSELRRDIDQRPSGQVFVVHLLLPHYSYIYDRECNIRKWDPYDEDSPITREELKKLNGRQIKYRLYFDQVECLHRKLESLFDDLQVQNRFKSTSIIIFGDHGARISSNRRPDAAVQRDYLDLFSTLVAVKPGDYNSNCHDACGSSVNDDISVPEIIAAYFRIPLDNQSKKDLDQVYFPDGEGYRALKMADFPNDEEANRSEP
jgi:hypothetical protein